MEPLRKFVLQHRHVHLFHSDAYSLPSPDVTHIVMLTEPLGSKVVIRTYKFFWGIAHKCWIVNLDWVLDSLNAGKPLPEDEYEIIGDDVCGECHYGPSMSRTSKKLLLSGYHFVLHGFTNNGKITYDGIYDLITTCGGRILEDLSQTEIPNIFVIMNVDEDDNIMDDSFEDHTMPVATLNWILDCITKYQVLDIEGYLVEKCSTLPNQSVDLDDHNSYISSESDTGLDPDYNPSSDQSDNSREEIPTDFDYVPPSDNESNQPVHMEVDYNIQSSSSFHAPRYRLMGEREIDPVANVQSSDDESEIIPYVVSDCNSVIPVSSNKGKANINVLTTNNIGKRHYDKTFVCLYCEVPQTKLWRHLETKHKNEMEVAKYLAENDQNNKRKIMLKLRNLGNYRHNSEVLRKGCGDLIVAYRPSEVVSAENYVPCEYCLGFYATSELWKHVKQCSLAPTDRKKFSKVLQSSRLLLPSPAGVSDGLKEVLATFSSDEIAAIVKSDPLILKLGEQLYRKHGHDREQYGFIRNTLREMGRLLKVLKENRSKSDEGLDMFIDPTKFQEVTDATKQVAGFSIVTHLYTTPSLALKIGHSLKKCAKIQKGIALQVGDESLLKKADSFEQLCELEWQNEVSGHALRSLEQKKRNSVKLIPLTEDVKLLTSYLTKKSEEAYLNLSKGSNQAPAWSTLNETTLALVILFNRRRQGEVSKMTLKDFERKHHAGNSNVVETLSPLEQKLCSSLERIELVGKRGRTVAILITQIMKRNIDLLIKMRHICGVSESNSFVFARPCYGSNSHIRGSDCLRNFSESCGAKFPTLLTTTKLRKQIATLSQIMNMKDHELDLLADFLGHDIRVHREFYRLPQETLQVAKVSKLLMMMESGSIVDLKGKTLDEIEVDTNEDIVPEDDDDEIENDDGDEDDHGDSCDEAGLSPPHKQRLKSTMKVRKRPWSEKEKAAVQRHFEINIRRNKLPGKKEILRCKTLEKSLSNRTWVNIKDFIRNQITTMKRREKLAN